MALLEEKSALLSTAYQFKFNFRFTFWGFASLQMTIKEIL